MAACSFLWSLAGLFIKLLDWNPFAIASARSAVSAVFLLVWLRKPRFTFSFPQLAAAVASTATMLLFVAANKTTTSANAILLQYTAPVHVALFGPWFLGEPSRRQDVVSIAVILGGMALFFMDQLSPP